MTVNILPTVAEWKQADASPVYAPHTQGKACVEYRPTEQAQLFATLRNPYSPLNMWAQHFHAVCRACGFYTDIETGKAIERNAGEQMMLMVTEIAEALEGVRKNKMDDHLPHRKSVEVELADLIIRVLDFAGYHNLDLAGAIQEKEQYNAVRADHKIENRRKADGKKF